jgi:hypothetical protein
MGRGYNTPEEAALAGFPPGYARVARVRNQAQTPECTSKIGVDEVEVELATNKPRTSIRTSFTSNVATTGGSKASATIEPDFGNLAHAAAT